MGRDWWHESVRIRSLADFLHVVAELQQPLPDGYPDYLRLKLNRLSPPPRPDVQKTTFSDDRYHLASSGDD
jgi:hypothetical protein